MDQQQNSEELNHKLGWKELQDTVLTLNLAVAQIQMSMRDGDHSVSTLIDSFTTLSGCVQVIDSASSEIPDQPAPETDCRSIRETVQTNVDLVAEKVGAAIVAFQFYDKLTQRLSHVSTSLTALSELVSEQDHIESHEEWHKLREQIRKIYSMVDEASMYEAIMQGENLETALKIATQHQQRPADESNNSGEVDLF
jgi:hypothetical protein